MEDTFVLMLVSIAIMVISVALVLVFRLTQRQRSLSERLSERSIVELQNLSSPPPEGVDVPITMSFSGIKNLGLFGFSRNNLNPWLKLFDDRIEYRVMFKGTKRYPDIEKLSAIGSSQLRFAFYGSIVTLLVWVANPADMPVLLQFFQSRGVALDAKARERIQG